jgi:hypothetical protein
MTALKLLLKPAGIHGLLGFNVGLRCPSIKQALKKAGENNPVPSAPVIS